MIITGGQADPFAVLTGRWKEDFKPTQEKEEKAAKPSVVLRDPNAQKRFDEAYRRQMEKAEEHNAGNQGGEESKRKP